MTIEDNKVLMCGNCAHYKVCSYKDYYKQCSDAVDKAINDLSFSEIALTEFDPGYLKCRHYSYKDTKIKRGDC